MLKILFIFCIIVSTIYSKTINININDIQINILKNTSIYIDKYSKLDFKDIKTKKFINSTTNYIRLGYTSSNVWLKFSIKNTSSKEMIRHLTLTNPMLDTIELFTKEKSGLYSKKSQGVLNFSVDDKSKIIHPNFKLKFNENEEKEFYLKVNSTTSANYFKLLIKNKTEFLNSEFSYQIILSLFFGAMLTLIVYNSFIFYFTKELSYLYYILYIIFVTINHSSYTTMIDILIGKEYSHIDAYLSLYYFSFAIIFAFLFIKEFLNLSKYKIVNLSFNIFIFVIIFIMILSIFVKYLIDIATFLAMISIVYILFICIIMYIKKHFQAKYILIGWSINTVGIIALAIHQFGYTTPIEIYPYFYEITVFFEAVIFSIALASRINKTTELENSLKTNKVLTKELHHRIKNNMQFIILMYRLKLANLTDEKIDEKLKETEGSIQAMSKTHEILYNQENLETIDTKLYFENLLDELKSSFNTKNINIHVDIKSTLDTQQAIYCGIILNELITNSFKYAFKDNKGEINISLKKEHGIYKFIIQDNGIGFDYKSKEYESFGLSFVKAMVEDELKGKILFENNKGTRVTISI